MGVLAWGGTNIQSYLESKTAIMGRVPHLCSNTKEVDNNFSSKKLFFALNVLGFVRWLV